jgi:hypothetical protein
MQRAQTTLRIPRPELLPLRLRVLLWEERAPGITEMKSLRFDRRRPPTAVASNRLRINPR